MMTGGHPSGRTPAPASSPRSAQPGLASALVAPACLGSRGLRSRLPKPLPAAQRPPPGPPIPVPQILLLEIHSIKSEGLRAAWRATPVTQPHPRGRDTRAASTEHPPGGARGSVPGPSRLEGGRHGFDGKLGFLWGHSPLPVRRKVARQAGAVSRPSPEGAVVLSRRRELLEPQDRGEGHSAL